MSQSTPPYLTAPGLVAAGIPHGFFSRRGGVSQGDFATLNTGPGSADQPEHVQENRRRCAAAIGVDGGRLMTIYQVHSADAMIVDAPWPDGTTPPKGDALVTAARGLALGALAADCMPLLLADPIAGVVSAVHAGWRGALGGVIEDAIAKMMSLGAKPEDIVAAIGPCLRPPNFQVGLELVEMFAVNRPGAERFFSADQAQEKRQLNLAEFAKWRLNLAGVDAVDDLGVCTLANHEAYFSYRGAMRAGHADYGRNLSAIALPAQ